jgi:hypothetical protein
MQLFNVAISIVIILIIIWIFYQQFYKYDYYNITPYYSCEITGNKTVCSTYNVHAEHSDQLEAAKVIKEIVRRNGILINYLQQKYIDKDFSPSLDPIKNNHIDIIPKSAISSDALEIKDQEYISDRIKQLLQHYDSTQIYEISPLNKSGVTSYTQDKKKLIFCLRKKEKNAAGKNELHDINTIMFVDIHELTHMMNDSWGHPPLFWRLFRFMLENAIECGVYKPVNFNKYPLDYCGLLLTYNPIFQKV